MFELLIVGCLTSIGKHLMHR